MGRLSGVIYVSCDDSHGPIILGNNMGDCIKVENLGCFRFDGDAKEEDVAGNYNVIDSYKYCTDCLTDGAIVDFKANPNVLDKLNSTISNVNNIINSKTRNDS